MLNLHYQNQSKMKKLVLATATLLSFYANSQEIENGTYIAKEKGQNIRLILKDNQYDLSLMSGKFEIKKDSIILNSQQKKSSFELVYTYNQSKLDIIKVYLNGNSNDFSNIYISTFNGSTTPIYKQVETKIEILDLKQDYKIYCEIDRADFLVLVKEDYFQVSEMAKFKIPENVSEISVDVQNLPSQNLKLAGTFNSQTKELTISENGKNPLVFQPEKQNESFEKVAIIPLETKIINNWNYPGKEQIKGDQNPAIDAATESINGGEDVTSIEKPKFQLQVENNLNAAIASNAKMAHKFLVIYYDPKNKNAKSDFDNFIKEQNKQLNYNMYDEYDKKYDLFNYYLASKQDEKWLKTKNIKSFPCLIAVNSDGEVLSQSDKSLFDLQNQFYYYDDFGKNLTRTNTLVNFKKAITKSFNDAENIKAFANLVALEIPYGYNEVLPVDAVKINQVEFVPPVISDIEAPKDFEKIIEVPADEQKGDPNTEQIIKTEEYLPPIVEDIKPDYNIFNKPIFDKKQVQLVWNNMIQNHKNDSKPNIDLAIVIIKELKNIGFSKQIFNEEKIIDETNFQAFEYVFKHINKIEQARLDSTYNVDAIHNFDPIENEIKYILNGQIKLVNPNTPIAFQQKIIDYYKRLLDYQKSGTFEKIDFNFQNDYFELLKTTAINSESDKQFVSEYDEYHNNLFNNKTNIIETLDNLFKTEKGADYESETWTQFKINYSNSANNAAWYVVEHSKNSESIKKAIKWSEHSLKISKKNHYYLDTLAQLYYKNGEKEKAFATQQLAIDNNFDDANEYITTLQKMKNGSY